MSPSDDRRASEASDPRVAEEPSRRVRYGPATAADWDEIARLLRAAALPLNGAAEHLRGFVVCRDGGALVGAACLETHGRTGLLRSVVVAPERRGEGIGAELVRRALDRAHQAALRDVVLLTETAAHYFPRFGFRSIERSDVPEEAKECAEFRGACADTAVAMLLPL